MTAVDPRPRADARASLLADAGAAACSGAFFRSRPFLDAEGATHSLVVETGDGRAVLPLIVRRIAHTDLHDAVSPYGYPGGHVEGAAPDLAALDLSGLDLVSIFVRDRLDTASLRGGTHRGRVLVHEPVLPRSTSKSFRRDVRRNEREGYAAEVLPGRGVDEATLEGFLRAYTETMRHVGAADQYFFTAPYLRRCLAAEGCWLAVVRAATGEVVAGELVVTSDGHLHSYLAGTRSAERDRSVGKNATARVLDLADELGLPLNVGGGLTESDGLAASKHSYSNAAATFVTHEIVAAPQRYALLAGERADTTFFPAYRAA